jgi:lysophospholipase L1-like esterase
MAAGARRRTVDRYVAMGDSFTAGAAGDAVAVRWPDLLAARLRRQTPGLVYRNLAVPGARSDEVAQDQLGVAVGLRPDVLTLVCGANDVLLSVRPDVERYGATLSAMLARLRRELPEAAVLTATTPNFAGHLGLHERSRRRVAQGLERLAEVTRLVARRHAVTCLEFAGHPEATARDNYAGDGYHPSPGAQRRAADAFGAALRSSFGIALDEEPE